MAHELNIMANGKASMFSVGETPWHGLGTILDHSPSMEQGILTAGMNWGVECRPLFTAEGQKVTHRALTRTDNGSVLSIVGPGYVPLQNVEAFQWFQPMLESGDASLHTAGSLSDGQKIWVLAQINKPDLDITGNGDVVRRFLLLSNSHGLNAVRVGFTPVRVVCANTLAASHSDRSSKLIRVNHTKHVHVAIKELREIMNIANQTFESTAEQFRSLAKKKVSLKDLRKYVKLVLEIDENENEDDLAPQTMRKFAEVLEFAESGMGNNGDTLWAGYNGVTEYLSYAYGRTQDRRLDSLWFGSNSDLNKKALEIALTMAS